MPEAGPIPPDQISTPDASTPVRRAEGPAARRTSLLVVLALGGLAALAALSTDMYLPALPAVTGALHSPAATVQLTLTAFLAGMAVGQLVVGPMSDRWGRRRPLLAGLVIYVVATAVCAFAPTVELLVGFRLLQGLSGAAGIVIARAVVRDLYSGVALVRFFSNLTLVSGLAPILAPFIGGQVLRVTDWRGIFVVLAVIGALLTLAAWRWLYETLPPARRHEGGLGNTLRMMRGLLADRPFAGYLLANGFTFAVLFGYLSASSFVVQDIYGASPQTYSLLFGLNSIGLVAFGQLNGKVLAGRVRMDLVLGSGLAVITVAAASLVVMASGALGRVGLLPVAAGLFVVMSSMSLVLTNSSALALTRAPHAAGTAAALLGTFSSLVGAIASPLVGIAGSHTALPMALVQLTGGLLAGACFVGLCRPWRRTVDAP